jgi:hypothetical protein
VSIPSIERVKTTGNVAKTVGIVGIAAREAPISVDEAARKRRNQG